MNAYHIKHNQEIFVRIKDVWLLIYYEIINPLVFYLNTDYWKLKIKLFCKLGNQDLLDIESTKLLKGGLNIIIKQSIHFKILSFLINKK